MLLQHFTLLPSLFVHTANRLRPGANLSVTCSDDLATVTWDVSGLNVDIEILFVEYSCISPSNTSVQVLRLASSLDFYAFASTIIQLGTFSHLIIHEIYMWVGRPLPFAADFVSVFSLYTNWF